MHDKKQDDAPDTTLEVKEKDQKSRKLCTLGCCKLTAGPQSRLRPRQIIEMQKKKHRANADDSASTLPRRANQRARAGCDRGHDRRY